jgi:meiotic recombination protein REC8
MDLDLPYLGDDLPEGEAFPTAGLQSSDQAEVIHSTSTASAPMRRKPRAPRVLPRDTTIELRNKDLSEWNTNYLENMDTARKHKEQNRVTVQAKKAAEQFLWGGGLGGIAQQFAGLPGPNPFDMFIGDNFFEFITGESRKKGAGTKHDRDSGIDDATQAESRSVRQKTNEPEGEFGRGLDEEGFFAPGGDEVELPREEVTALDDDKIFSAMPWNNSASRHGSSAVPGSRQPGFLDRGRVSNRPSSRLVSASPLHGRGPPLALDALRSLDSEGDMGMGGGEYAPQGPSSPPTVIGAPPQISTRVRDALPAEDANFLDYVANAIIEKRNRAQAQLDPMIDVEAAEATHLIDDITFEALLPPHESTKIVACSGFLMVLTLGTKGLLDVQQPEDFGDINLKLTAQAKVDQVVEVSDDEDDEEKESSDGGVEFVKEQKIDENEENGEEEEQVQVQIKQELGLQEEEEEDGEGHFEEQFAAGHAPVEEDDHDSLYGL